MQLKTILSAFVRPVKEKLPFFCLFLIAIDAIPLRLFISNIHYRNIGAIGEFLLEDFPRAGVIAYLATLVVYFFRKKWVLMGGYVLATILLAVCLFLHLVFGKTLQPDIVTLILETNSQESSEFISSFLFTKGGIATIVICLLYVALAIVCERRKSRIKLRISGLKYKFIFYFLLFIFLFQGMLNLRFFYNTLCAKTVDVLPYNDGKYDAVTSLFYSFYSIKLVNEEMKQAIEVSRNIKQENVTSYADSLNVIYVIGESYIKSHAQLYGYNLPTTPNLLREKESGNLFVFDNVVSPFNSTTLTMKNTFCCNSIRDKERWADCPYFPTIFKKAGFDVYFWDVQKDDSIQAIFEYSLNSFVYNKDLAQESYTKISKNVFQYDDQAVSDFSAEVKKTGKCNLIIFHLMGQHVAAKRRYPHTKQFDKFTFKDIKSKASYLDDSKRQMIAEYDNATLYNDYVLKHIIDLYRNKNTVLLYFSDHGEEVFDYRDSFGRGILDNKMLRQGLRSQYEVPFMIWCSDKYIQMHPQKMKAIKSALHRPFETDNLCNVLFDLAGISTPIYKPARDVLSPKYQRKDRVVEGKYNYDKIMKLLK